MGEPGPDSVAAELTTWIGQMPDGVDQDIEAARQRIGRISRQFGQVLASAAARHELTVGDWEALSALQRSGPVCTPKQIAAMLGLTAGTVSIRIDRLLQAGLVEPVAAADGRSRPVRLTRKGRHRWRAATQARVDHERQIFAEALTSEQLAQLNPLLTALLAGFEAEFGPASRHDVTR
ncbi:MAG TPA: MarR family winged helix-turn-helix transcriptional regulator [Kutzneria sp.]